MFYQALIYQAILNTERFLKDNGTHDVKLEDEAGIARIIYAHAQAGISVMEDISLISQASIKMGCFKIYQEEDRLLNDGQSVTSYCIDMLHGKLPGHENSF